MNWTTKDSKRARKEGWDYKHGCIMRVYDEVGMCPFISISQIYNYIAAQSSVSDWHRSLYMDLPWTGAEDKIARNEGWIYLGGNLSPGVPAIQRFGTTFPSTEAAQEFVQEQAEKGSALHIKVLVLLTKNRLLEN